MHETAAPPVPTRARVGRARRPRADAGEVFLPGVGVVLLLAPQPGKEFRRQADIESAVADDEDVDVNVVHALPPFSRRRMRRERRSSQEDRGAAAHPARQ